MPPATLLRRALLAAAAAVLTASAAFGAAPTAQELPDIGTPVDQLLTASDEYKIGAMIIQGLRDQGQILDDPELNEYIQSVGSRLASQAQEGNTRFTFFVVKDRGINAFALPGGFVCVNAGLILATSGESELAGVLAHEISHVTQRHIARSYQDASKASLASTAAMLAAILLGAMSGNSNVGMAGVMVGQGAAMQHQLNFSRENEYEADRVGIGVMAAAGYDPNAMGTFFETLERRMGNPGPNAKILEFLQTHPVTSGRVAEAKNRAAMYPIVRPVDTTGYRLARERLRVMTLGPEDNPREVYADAASVDLAVSDYRYYGRALALVQANAAGEAVPILRDLVQRHPDTIEYHSALGQALLAAGDVQGSRAVLARAKELFPRNVPVTVRYAETLMRAGDARLAHAVLLDLFNNVAPTQAQVRQIALVASAAGEAAEANYYMAEYHVMSGDLTLAIETLRLALSAPNLTPVQRSRFKARIDELKEYLPPRVQAAVDRGDPLPAPKPDGRHQ
ncbi:MAG TPA: M48 family metalloprotease [Steroidobacteraceae bacterium]|nr:M48 family metalloprotease [Steroidobacteraceae bacterium]